MDSKLVLVKLVTLLYCESICPKVINRSVPLAQEIISRLKLPSQVVETDEGRNVIIGLRDTVLWLCDQADGEAPDYYSLLQRMRMVAGDDINVFQAFEDVEQYLHVGEDELFRACAQIENELRNFQFRWAIQDIIYKAHRDVFYGNKAKDWKEFVNNLVADLETYGAGWSDEQASYILDMASSSDPNSFMEILERAKDDAMGHGGLSTGWQAINRMMGASGQLRRGMFVLVGGLTHSYKSGFVHDMFRHFCLYNDPEPDDPEKTPTLMLISSENRAEEDITRMYVALKENETGKAVNENEIDPAEASEYISRRLSERGWEAAMLRIDPNDFTYNELFNLVLKYESQGYEIHGICFDYLNMINKRGCTTSSMTGEDTRALMQRTRTFMSARNILFITPHQLSQEAMNLKRAGVANFVEEVAGKNYWDGSKRIANEADLEIFVDIVERDKSAFLSVKRGKHRTVKVTPVADRFCYLPFDDVGFIPEDINGEDRSVQTLIQSTATADIDFD